jgi:membrane protein required for colicin V production
MPMHWLDIIVLVLLAVGAAMGFWTGLLWQVARVVSLAFSIYLAILLNVSIADWLSEQWKDVNPVVNRVVAFIGVFLAVYLVLYFLTHLIHKLIKATKLETLDRLLGSLLGILKMAALSACVLGMMAALDLEIFREWFKQAAIAPEFARGTEVAVKWVPQEFRDNANESIQQVREQLEKKITDAAMDTLKGDPAKK